MSKLSKDMDRAASQLIAELNSGVNVSEAGARWSASIDKAWDDDAKRKHKTRNTIIGGIIGGPVGAIIGSQWDDD